MGRGMARHKQIGGGPKYDLKGVAKGSNIALMNDLKYHRESLGWRTGVIEQRAAGRVYVVWDDEPGAVEWLKESDVRYWVDTNRCRITPPTKKSIFSENMRT